MLGYKKHEYFSFVLICIKMLSVGCFKYLKNTEINECVVEWCINTVLSYDSSKYDLKFQRWHSQ